MRFRRLQNDDGCATRTADLDDAMFSENYNRVPFGFSHNLHRLALSENEALRSLCEIYAAHPEDYFVSRSASSAGTVFYSVPKRR